MATRTGLSDHCILHAADVEGGTPSGSRPPISAKVLATLPLLLVDRKQHFTGIRGAAWRMFGVDRSPKNPNVCNI